MKSIRIGATLALSALLLAGCNGTGSGEDPADELEVTTTQTPTFQPQNVSTIEVPATAGTVTDTGLNVEWTYQGSSYGATGGTVLTFLLKNLNDVPVPPEAIGDPTLERSDGAGGTIDVDLLTSSTITNGLDVPLGSLATTNVRYTFDVAPGNLWDAEVQVSNVAWSGSLNN